MATVAGTVLFVITSFVSLAVWAINAKINASDQRAAAAENEARLREENEHLKLEARVARELVAPVVERFSSGLRQLEERLHLRDEVRAGFKSVHASLDARLPVRDSEGPRSQPRG